MTLTRVLVTGAGLWFAAQVIGGVRLVDGLDPLATIGTVLLVALMLCAVHAATRGARRVVAASIGGWPLPAALIAAVAVNALLFWVTTRAARAIGLGYTVDGLVPALLGSLIVVLTLGVLRPSAAR
jgi:putative membrane protein